MRALSLIAILVALVALVAAVASMRPRPAPESDLPARLGLAEQRVAALEKRLEALSADQTRLSEAALHRDGIAAAPPDEHMKELVRAELQAQMRNRQAPGNGRAPTIPPVDAATVKEQLGLDDAKSEQVAQLLTQFRTTVRDIWRSGGDRDANMAAMKAEQAKAEAKAAEFLTPDELAKVKAWVEKQDADRRNRRPQRADAPANAAGADAAPKTEAPPKAPQF